MLTGAGRDRCWPWHSIRTGTFGSAAREGLDSLADMVEPAKEEKLSSKELDNISNFLADLVELAKAENS